MEKRPTEDGYETEFVETLKSVGEVVIPYLEADTVVDSMDRTRAYIMGLIEKHDLRIIGDGYTVSSVRFTPEHGHHYWVRTWNPVLATPNP
jgi:hypothetical protein